MSVGTQSQKSIHDESVCFLARMVSMCLTCPEALTCFLLFFLFLNPEILPVCLCVFPACTTHWILHATATLCVELISEAVQRQTLLGNVIHVHEEVEGHLDNVTAHTVEPVLDFPNTAGELFLDDVAVLDLASVVALALALALLLGAGDDEVAGEELVVVLPSPHMVVGHVVEYLGEDLGVCARRALPQVPELARHRILHQAIGGGAPVVHVRAALDGRPVVVGPVPALVGQQTEVLAEDLAAEGCGELGGCVGTAGHLRLDGRGVLDDDSDLGVVGAELRAIVEVGGADDDEVVVGDEELGVDVELLADEGVHLGFRLALPGDAVQVRTGVHVAGRDGVPGVIADAGGGLLVAVVLGVAPAPAGTGALATGLVASTDGIVMLTAGVLVRDTALALSAGHVGGDVDAVVVAKVVEADVAARVVDTALVSEGFYDAVSAAADGVVLELHDGAGAQCVVRLEIAGEGGNGGHIDNDLEILAVSVGAEDTVDDGAADLVGDGVLLIARGSDEELGLC